MNCNCCGDTAQTQIFSENNFHLVQCPTCDLLYLSNMPTRMERMTEMEAGHFADGQFVIDADKQAASERALSHRFRGYVETARRHAKSGKWLDIGCGSGTLLTLVREAGYSPEGIELTTARFEAAMVRGFPVYDVPVEDIAFPDNSFDVISMINVFSHLTDPAGTMAELQRILTPDGVLLLVTGEVGTGVQQSDVARWNLGDHLYFLGERTLGRYAENTRLSIVEKQQVWLPNEMFSREALATKGLSWKRNLLKTIISKFPGLFKLFRATMLRRHASNKVHSTTFCLVKS